jgi:hypothetical protein
MKPTQVSELGRIADALEALLLVHLGPATDTPVHVHHMGAGAPAGDATKEVNEAPAPVAETPATEPIKAEDHRERIADLVRGAYADATDDAQRLEMKKAYAQVRTTFGFDRLADVPDATLYDFETAVISAFNRASS